MITPSFYSYFFQKNNYAFLICDEHLNIIESNQMAEQLTCYTKHELEQMSLLNLIAQKKLLKQLYFTNNPPVYADVICANGNSLPVEINSNFIDCEDNSYIILTLKEPCLSIKTAQIVQYFMNPPSQGQNLEEMLWCIIRNCIASLGLSDCVIYLVDNHRNKLVQKAAYGPKNPRGHEILQPIEISLGEGIVGNVALTGKAEIVADTSADERYIVDDNIRLSEIAIPLTYQGKVIGVIDSEHPEKNFFQEKHLNLFNIIASLFSTQVASIQKDLFIEPILPSKCISRDNKLHSQITEVLEKHLDDSDFNVEKLQKILGMSKIQLYRKVKGLFGETPVEFLRNYRLKKAAELLAVKHDSVSQIAYQVGFNNLSYFTKCFKKQFGIVPSEFA